VLNAQKKKEDNANIPVDGFEIIGIISNETKTKSR
jgi:hypothetical protein